MKEAWYNIFDANLNGVGRVRANNKREAIEKAREQYGDNAKFVSRVTRWQIKRSNG